MPQPLLNVRKINIHCCMHLYEHTPPPPLSIITHLYTYQALSQYWFVSICVWCVFKHIYTNIHPPLSIITHLFINHFVGQHSFADICLCVLKHIDTNIPSPLLSIITHTYICFFVYKAFGQSSLNCQSHSGYSFVSMYVCIPVHTHCYCNYTNVLTFFAFLYIPIKKILICLLVNHLVIITHLQAHVCSHNIIQQSVWLAFTHVCLCFQQAVQSRRFKWMISRTCALMTRDKCVSVLACVYEKEPELCVSVYVCVSMEQQ